MPMTRAVLLLLSILAFTTQNSWSEDRQTVVLDGNWDVAQGTMDAPPTQFTSKVPVPGLIDMAQPAFSDVGVKSAEREAFWYRKKFQVDRAVPAVANLRIAKAFFGTKVYLNGTEIGEHD